MARRKDPDTYILNSSDTPVRCRWKELMRWLCEQAQSWRDRTIVKVHDVDGTIVKTLFTGVDARTVKNTYGIEPGTGPLLFMTISYIPMVVGQTIHRRYSTFDEAVEGHFEVLAEVRETEKGGSQ